MCKVRRSILLVMSVCVLVLCSQVFALDKPAVTYGNLSVGKFYTFSLANNPEYSDVFPTEWSSGSRLTDEELGTNWPLTPWLGWFGEQAFTLDIVLDLGKDCELDTIRMHTMSHVDYGIHYPSQVVYYVKAQDADQWTQYGSTQFCPADTQGHSDVWLEAKSGFVKARYIKYTVSALGNEHLFIDEIEVFGKIVNSWKHVPDYGCYHGAYPSNKYWWLDIPNYESKIGKQTSMALWYAEMGSCDFTNYLGNLWSKPGRLTVNIDYSGARLLQVGFEAQKYTTCKQIAEGKYDAYFKDFFTQSLDNSCRLGIDDPVWLRINSEMNGGWVFESAGNEKWYGGDPLNYRRAWRRMFNIAEQVGAADGQIFVWSPNAYTYNGPEHMPDKYYPGDQYVDWVGMSIYVQGDIPYPNNLISGTAGPGAFDFYGTYSYKPMMISEGSFVEKAGVDGIKWINQWFDVPKNYPMVKALVWFYMDGATYDTINDEPYNSLFRQRIADDFFLRQSIAGRLDADNSHSIDLVDIAAMSENWLKLGSNNFGDVDGDNSVNFEDMCKFLNEWLQ